MMAAMDLAPLLNAHGYLRVERPPELWEADVDDVALVRVVGEMVAAALLRGTALSDVVLRVNNVTVEADGGADPSPGPAAGDYVAVSVIGGGDWGPEMIWRPGGADDSVLINPDLSRAVRMAGIPFGYTRSSGDGGSVTVFLPRADPSQRGAAG